MIIALEGYGATPPPVGRPPGPPADIPGRSPVSVTDVNRNKSQGQQEITPAGPGAPMLEDIGVPFNPTTAKWLALAGGVVVAFIAVTLIKKA